MRLSPRPIATSTPPAELQQQQAVKSATIEGFKTGVAAGDHK